MVLRSALCETHGVHMSEDVQGFFKMLATSPKTVSLAAGVACAAPYFMRDTISLPDSYSGILLIASVFFLTLFAIQVVIVGFGWLRDAIHYRRRLKDRFEGLAFEELDLLAAFTVQQQHALYFPSDAPVLHRLFMRDMLTTIRSGGPLQSIELQDWARAVLDANPSLLKGADGVHLLEVSNKNIARYENGELGRY